MKQAGLTTLFKWALGGDSIGSGNKVLLVSGDDRIRYRLGLAISEAGGRIVWRDGWRGLLPQLKHLAPRVILLDERTVKYDLDSILEPILEVAPLLNYKIVLLIEKASGASILRWKQMGVYDIVLLDPSLRDTEKRVTLWLDLEEKP